MIATRTACVAVAVAAAALCGVGVVGGATASCVPTLRLPAGAALRCTDDDECPADARCLADADGGGLCVPRDSPCLTANGDPVGDGTPCDDGVCTGGVCRLPGCGDGLVDVGAGEECDPLVDGRCRADCTVPFCGDGIVDASESCDRPTGDCRACVLLCISAVGGGGGPIERRSNCDLDGDNGCECDLQPVLDLQGGFVWHSVLAEDGAVLFTVYTPTERRLLRFRDGGVTELLAGMDLMSLALVDGLPHVLFDDGSRNARLARVDVAGGLSVLRSGLRMGDAVDFVVDRGFLYVVNDAAVVRATVDGDDAFVPHSDACAGLTDLILCDGRLFCSDVAGGVVRAIDVDSGLGVDVYSFNPDDAAPRRSRRDRR